MNTNRFSRAQGSSTATAVGGHNDRGSRSRRDVASLAAVAAVFCLTASPTAAIAQSCDLSAPGACNVTSAAALRACRHDVKDDYWTAYGICKNFVGDRRTCIDDARDERTEALDECVVRCEARQELCDAFGPQRFDPVIDPANFLSPAEIAAAPNPFWPLVPGTIHVYEGGGETITVTVTDETKEILGVTCIVVTDVVEEDGEPIEETVDWYAQDEDGNVWYFGEIAQNFEDGELSDLDGSWTGGVDGAKPGIVFEATPQVGDIYRQEFLLREAEDVAEVLSLNGDETAAAASCAGACVVTEEYTPLEPDGTEHKYYAAGIGLVLELNPDTGDRVELVEVTLP